MAYYLESLGNIDPSDWRNNSEELFRLNGHNGIMLHPSTIGKNQMWDIAKKLLEARKQKGMM